MRKPETDLCAEFMAWARACGWTPYAETAGWDVLLVANDGTQVGVQAKTRFTMQLLSQAAEQRWGPSAGPDFRAVLVPDHAGHGGLCAALGLTLMSREHDGFGPGLPVGGLGSPGEWRPCNHSRRHELPEHVPDVPAGVPAPVQLTRWKVAALKICAALASRGHVTRSDFRDLGIDHRRWLGARWLVPGSEPGQFVAGADLFFPAQHPEVYPKVLAEVSAKLSAGVSLR